MIIAALSGYMLLAAFDMRSGAALSDAVDEANRELTRLGGSISRAAAECRELHAQRRRTLEVWAKSSEDELPGHCRAECAVPLQSPDWKVSSICATQGSSIEAQLAEARAKESALHQAYERHERASSADRVARNRLTQSRLRWENDRSPNEQAGLHKEFLSARDRAEATRRKLGHATTQLRRAKVGANSEARGEPSAAQRLIHAQAKFQPTSEAVQRLLQQLETTRNQREKQAGQLIERRKQTLKLPVLDIELDRAHFNLVAPLLMCTLFGFFGFYILHLKRRVKHLHAGAPSGSFVEGDLAAFPWPLLLHSERSQPLRAVFALGICMLVPIVLLVVLWPTGQDAIHECRDAADAISAGCGSQVAQYLGLLGATVLALYFLWHVGGFANVWPAVRSRWTRSSAREMRGAQP